MDRSVFPVEIAIALLFLAGMVFVGDFVLAHNSPTSTQPASGVLGIMLPAQPSAAPLSCCDPDSATQPASTNKPAPTR